MRGMQPAANALLSCACKIVSALLREQFSSKATMLRSRHTSHMSKTGFAAACRSRLDATVGMCSSNIVHEAESETGIPATEHCSVRTSEYPDCCVGAHQTVRVMQCLIWQLPCAQGHLQVILNLAHSPLLQRRLRLIDRLLYCSGIWSYFVGVLSTFVFIAVPLVTIWIGAQCDAAVRLLLRGLQHERAAVLAQLSEIAVASVMAACSCQ